MPFVTITKTDDNKLKAEGGATVTVLPGHVSYSKQLVAQDRYWRSIANAEDVVTEEGYIQVVKNKAYVTVKEDAETQRVAFVFGDSGEYVNRVSRKGGSLRDLSFQIIPGTYPATYDSDVGGWVIDAGIVQEVKRFAQQIVNSMSDEDVSKYSEENWRGQINDMPWQTASDWNGWHHVKIDELMSQVSQLVQARGAQAS